ncbi:MAG TPA: plastocyanin/azurin family copper-binding protein [Longimicrobiaceae bacterium]|nr:plastocyanin/azurin family copper-binding protein [Longimicrobiaceae bacterium]
MISTRIRMLLTTLMVATIGAAAAAACSEGGGGTGPDPQVQEIRINQSFAFAPTSVTVSPGTTIRWINDSSTFHTVTSETGAWTEGQLTSQGSTFQVTLNTPGTYRYRCVPHSTNFTSGMVGVIIVQ